MPPAGGEAAGLVSVSTSLTRPPKKPRFHWRNDKRRSTRAPHRKPPKLRPCSISPGMDNRLPTQGGQTLRVARFPTPPRPFAYGLTRWRLPNSPLKKASLKPGEDLAPLLSDGEGLSFGDSFALPRSLEVLRYPLHFPTEPGQYEWGLGRPQCRLKAAFMDCATSPPVAAIKPLGGALGELPALAPTGIQSSREIYAGRGSSPEKLYPGEKLTCKPCADRAGRVNFAAWASDTLPGFLSPS